MTKQVDISDAGRALCHLSKEFDAAEAAVHDRLANLLKAQDRLREAIINRDAVQRALTLTAQFVAKETK